MLVTVKLKVEAFVRVIMAIIVLFNLVIPTTVLAISPSSESNTSISLDTHQNVFEQSVAGVGFNVVVPKVAKTEVPTSQVVEGTPTTEFLFTPTSDLLSTQISTLTDADNKSTIQFSFSALPAQANPGDEVVFTATITNNSKTEIKELIFSNILPDQLRKSKSEDDNFNFDSKTNLLTWENKSKKDSDGIALLAGETVTFQYTATVVSNINEELQIIDEADLYIDGAVTPISASLELGIFSDGSKKDFTALGSQGGEAVGIDGQITINVPNGELSASEGILIENLSEDIQVDLQQPFLMFQLDVASQKQENDVPVVIPSETVTIEVQPTETISVTSTPTVEITATIEPISSPDVITEEPALQATSEASTEDVAISATSTITITPTIEISSPTLVATQTATLSSTSIVEETLEAVLISTEQDIVSSLAIEEGQFNKPVEITISFDEILDLSELGAEYTPYVVTLDEKSDTWVNVPLTSIDRDANTITVETTHFSIWGAGVGISDGVTAFDNPYPSLFTGSSHYSFPLWTPPGRNGMSPSLSLSYSSSIADGLLGDIQAPWVGMGWNVDSIEIARKITNGACGTGCGSGSYYGYENKFLLLFNGSGHELIPDGTVAGRYHTKSESFLYIQLHNNSLGNNSPTASNLTSEWWEVVQKDGTRWRLGWNTDSEQLAAMKSYPGAATGTWATLGYAGSATEVVASRWRVDQGTDTHGNQITFNYFEENSLVAGTAVNYNRASYLDLISYNSHTSGTPAAGYSVDFVLETRGAGLVNEVPTAPSAGANWDTYHLNKIDVKYGATIVRTYDLSYAIRSYTDGGVTWYTTVLTSIATTGGGSTAPTTTFTYADKLNRLANGSSSNEWSYPRLATVANGLGSTTTYTYANDSRPYTSWYNWRVETLDVTDGVNANPMKTTFAYTTPCYNDVTAGWCNGTNVGDLIGYAQTNATTKDFNGTTSLAIAVHKFYTDEQKAGREYETQNQNGSGTILSQTNTTYTVATSGFPSGGYFTYASAVEQLLLAGSLTLVNRSEYTYDTTTGNLTNQKQYDGTPSLYRQTDYQYVSNTAPSVWILNTLARLTLKDSSGTTLAVQEYGYDGSLPASGSPTLGELTLSRVVNGSQTIDTKYIYDAYGNVTETRVYKNYGATGSQPSGAYLTNTITYDSTLKTYPVSVANSLSHTILLGYNYSLGLPTTITDPNGNVTTTAYDGLGRVTSVTYPGYAQANIKYTYPTVPITAPAKLKFEVWDQTASVYRSAWQVMDGLGRTIQTQSPYETAGYLILNDTSYNAQGLPYYQGLPRTLSGTGGNTFTPTWGSVPHLTNSYDALGRITAITYADGNSETYSYSGLRTTFIDRNNHQKIQEVDAFGRLVKAEEYTGAGSYSLYATTNYEYDPRDLLKKVIDAAGNLTTMTYNGFGRKTAMSDPDMGSWSYGYGVLGTLTSQTDARNCVTTIAYDDLNRPTQKTYSGSGACSTTPSVTYSYDSTTSGNEGIGHRTGMTDGSGSTTWLYNTLGQVTNETQIIDGATYSTSATYDSLGRPLTQTLPSTETLAYTYNVMGALSSMSGTNTYLSQIHHAASGQVIDQLLGNGLLQQSCYEANTLRLGSTRVYSGALQTCIAAPASPKINLSYSYQPNGNVSQVVDATRSETLNYTYDELDRLLNISGPYNLSYEYNAIGNITKGGSALVPNKITTGYRNTCAVTVNGADLCWGGNASAQLGDGTYTQRNSPAYVNGLTNGTSTSASAGDLHSCALTASGGVKCWGYNSAGQLGDGTYTERTTPVNVSGLTSGVTAITSGAYHTCALTTAGGVKCWGQNNAGQLGDNSTTNRTTPVNVSGLTSGVVAITAGGYHTCALLTTGGIKCWGDNGYGQVGDGTLIHRYIPVDVNGLTSGVIAISAGHWHTCALLTTGGIKCWGRNNNGQLGDGTTTNHSIPADVTGLTSGISAITTGGYHTCALTTTGGAKCWGYNTDGEVGDGTTVQRTTAVDVSGLTSTVATIDSSNYHTCAVTTAKAIKCWGKNDTKQLSDPSLAYSASPLTANLNATYTYNSTHKHAVASLSTGETYTYDANGNMTQRIEAGITYTQTYDAENRLISVTTAGQTTQFLYNGDGDLVKKTNPNGSKTIYVNKVYEVDKTSAGTVSRTVTYYPIAGAMRIDSTLYYILKDHLGSASVVTDSTGNVVGEQRYYPFGETRLTTGTIFTDKLFTGQQEMSGLGIYNYGARFYSPKLGRFLSADTIIPNPANPQDFNRFSYVRNNPLRYTDPTGHFTCSKDRNSDDYCPPAVSGGSTTQPYIPPSGGGGGGGSGSTCNSDTLTNSSGTPCHDYTITTVVCPAEYSCTEAEMQIYLTMFQYPGQLPWNPVQDGGSYTVFPFNLAPLLAYLDPGLYPSSIVLNQILSPLGAITVDFGPDGSITNTTELTHIFYEGQVENSLSQNADGDWVLTTQGAGTNTSNAIAGFNQQIGQATFQIQAETMGAYIIADQTIGFFP